jgi:hypothetical protein
LWVNTQLDIVPSEQFSTFHPVTFPCPPDSTTVFLVLASGGHAVSPHRHHPAADRKRLFDPLKFGNIHGMVGGIYANGKLEVMPDGCRHESACMCLSLWDHRDRDLQE